ncbi:MAG: hypothetical protein R2800_10540 [Flavipsychrobacter sp.]
MKRLGILILLLMISYTYTVAQDNLFTEGIVVYDVTLDPPQNEEGLTQYKGTYTIMVKGNAIRKELLLENGFKDISLYNGDNNTAYALRTMGGKFYAIELDMKEIEEELNKRRGFTMLDGNGQMDILNNKAQKATITYKDGSTCDLYYSGIWKPSELMFNYFPNIEVMPMSFVLSSAKNMNMYFKASSIKVKTIETAQFRIPKEYKIVTKDEYKQMR